MSNEIFHPVNDYNYYKEFLKRAFTILNGEVNTNILARRLAIQNLERDENELGYSLGLFIVLDLVKIYNFYSKNEFPYDEIMKGVILFVLIHELSHCDQKTNSDYTEVYIKNLEFANNQNCMRFIYRKEQFLKSTFGNFKIPNSVFSVINKEREFFKTYPHFSYEQASSIREIFMSLLKKFTNRDIDKYICQYQIKNFDLIFNFANKYEKRFNLFFDGVYSLSISEFECILKMLAFSNMKTNNELKLGYNPKNSYNYLKVYLKNDLKYDSSVEILI